MAEKGNWFHLATAFGSALKRVSGEIGNGREENR
jgi:hypothetical protein